MFPTQETIDTLAGRIKQAFARRYPDRDLTRTSPGVWVAAASGLLMMHRNSPSVPLDPEMFVAVQPSKSWADPWADLAQEDAFLRYRRHVRRVVAQLRAELKAEIRLAERRMRRGASLEAVLNDAKGTISALGRYALARRVGDDDLAERLRPAAERQHRSCPLYQQACRALLPLDTYPLPRQSELLPGLVIPAGLELPCFSTN